RTAAGSSSRGRDSGYRRKGRSARAGAQRCRRASARSRHAVPAASSGGRSSGRRSWGRSSVSDPPEVRRTDKRMPEARVREMLEGAYAGRLATVGPDGWPYVVPLLYVWKDGEIWVHNTQARGHLRANVEHATR